MDSNRSLIFQSRSKILSMFFFLLPRQFPTFNSLKNSYERDSHADEVFKEFILFMNGKKNLKGCKTEAECRSPVIVARCIAKRFFNCETRKTFSASVDFPGSFSFSTRFMNRARLNRLEKVKVMCEPKLIRNFHCRLSNWVAREVFMAHQCRFCVPKSSIDWNEKVVNRLWTSVPFHAQHVGKLGKKSWFMAELLRLYRSILNEDFTGQQIHSALFFLLGLSWKHFNQQKTKS